MKKIFVKKMIIALAITTCLIIPAAAKSNYNEDFDPLVDIEVTVEIQKIRAFDKVEKQLSVIPFIALFPPREYVDEDSDPDFYVKVIIEGEEFTSNTWHETKYIYSPDFTATLNVPDDQEFVDITIQLWDSNANDNIKRNIGTKSEDSLCDIGGNANQDVNITYSIKTGHWTGEDQINDPSGYGRLNGCDDGTIYKRDKDCELWFNVYQNDYDGDGVPYWTEVNDYGTDPETDNTGEDSDNDDVPFEWEWKWGYDPLSPESHSYLDPDGDSIDNYEEYLTSQWFSDPFRKDFFIELDQMEEGPNGETSIFPEVSKELLYTAWDRQNIVYHLDDGKWEGTASNWINFDSTTTRQELNNIYNQNFDRYGWRRGVFHYGVLIYHYDGVYGHRFGDNRFQISSKGLDNQASNPSYWLDRNEVYAGAYMHETGHTLDFWPIPGHSSRSSSPLKIGWWLTMNYRSCMSYGYIFYTVDYSDGSRPPPDYDDWERMDLSAFEDEW